MKRILTLFLLTLFFVATAQTTNLVEYTFKNKRGVNDVGREYLVFNDSELYYANIKNDDHLNYEDEK